MQTSRDNQTSTAEEEEKDNMQGSSSVSRFPAWLVSSRLVSCPVSVPSRPPFWPAALAA